MAFLLCINIFDNNAFIYLDFLVKTDDIVENIQNLIIGDKLRL
jgi:hypothetical protein